MIWVVIISGFCFVAGNILWPVFGDPKYFYVPLSVHLFSAMFVIAKGYKRTELQAIFMEYFTVLAAGNIIKQAFYTPLIAQINDYYWAGIVSAWLLYNLVKWGNRKKK